MTSPIFDEHPSMCFQTNDLSFSQFMKKKKYLPQLLFSCGIKKIFAMGILYDEGRFGKSFHRRREADLQQLSEIIALALNFNVFKY